MIICEKKDCVGCSSCVSVCPKQCIEMKYDSEGFLHPSIDEDICIKCQKCVKVCPVNNVESFTRNTPRRTLAAWSKDDKIIKNSSSGGVFTELALSVISDGGVIFGACQIDGYKVVHTYITNKEELSKLQGSKYIQSDINNSYLKVREFLKLGRKVLFTGTSCQIMGLKSFLGKDNELLFTCEVVCHGVPSPGVFKDYISMLSNKYNDNIISIRYRDKSKGWKSPRVIFEFSKGKKKKSQLYNDEFLLGFRKDLYLRECCYNKNCRSEKRISDITLGDFWGCRNISNKQSLKGVSLVLINTERGEKLINNINNCIEIVEKDFKEASLHNKALNKQIGKISKRDEFFKDYKSKDFKDVYKKYLKIPIHEKALRKIKADINYIKCKI